MATLGQTEFAWGLKARYLPDAVKIAAWEDHPLFAMIPKTEDFGGKNISFGVLYSDIEAGASIAFATAQAGKSGHEGQQFTVGRKKDYAIASVDNETIKSAMGNENALLEAFESVVDSAIRTVSNSISRKLYGDGSGDMGTIGSIASNVITLLDPEDVSNFKKNQVLVFAASTAANLRDSGNSATVTAVDADAGTVTINATPTGVVANDHIFRKGDYTAANDRLCLMGLAGWVPVTVTDSFFGVTRTSDSVGLAGSRVNCTGLPLDEALTQMAISQGRNGGKGSGFFMSHLRYAELINLLGSKVQYIEQKVGEIGFGGIMVHTPKGSVKVFPDLDCPGDKCYLLDFRGMRLHSLGPCPQLLDYGSGSSLFEYNADGVEVRVGFYGNLLVNAPKWQVVGYNFGA